MELLIQALMASGGFTCNHHLLEQVMNPWKCTWIAQLVPIQPQQ